MVESGRTPLLTPDELGDARLRPDRVARVTACSRMVRPCSATSTATCAATGTIAIGSTTWSPSTSSPTSSTSTGHRARDLTRRRARRGLTRPTGAKAVGPTAVTLAYVCHTASSRVARLAGSGNLGRTPKVLSRSGGDVVGADRRRQRSVRGSAPHAGARRSLPPSSEEEQPMAAAADSPSGVRTQRLRHWADPDSVARRPCRGRSPTPDPAGHRRLAARRPARSAAVHAHGRRPAVRPRGRRTAARHHHRLRDVGRAARRRQTTPCSSATPSPATPTPPARPVPAIPTPGWWDGVIGPGRPLDTDRYFVVCANVLGGCQGSSGPASPRPDRPGCYGPDFPVVSIRDMVRTQARLGRRPRHRSLAHA